MAFIGITAQTMQNANIKQPVHNVDKKKHQMTKKTHTSGS